MFLDQILLAAVKEKFGNRAWREGTGADPLISFPAQSAAIGDVRISSLWVDSRISPVFSVNVSIGDIVHDSFTDFDVHIDDRARVERLVRDVVRFLEHLFADRLVFWTSTDGRSRGWRECAGPGSAEPLVLNDRSYSVYLWSGPLPEWRASRSILARGVIRDEREYEILKMHLADADIHPDGAADRTAAVRLIEEYERRDNPSAGGDIERE